MLTRAAFLRPGMRLTNGDTVERAVVRFQQDTVTLHLRDRHGQSRIRDYNRRDRVQIERTP